MMRRILAVVAICCVAGATARGEPRPEAKAFSRFRTPTDDAPRSIGETSSGCILGAVALPLDGGPGFVVARPERHRNFGHPDLVAFIVGLGAQLVDAHLPPLSVGDLGQPRGGPAPTGHASHQTGLDADLYFLPPNGADTTSVVESVDAGTKRPSTRFTAAMVETLRRAAADPRVERIFIDPVLKRGLCERPPQERAWLHKIAPWWGHDDHFHVRLACPASSPDCVPQKPMAGGDGCADLAWWFDERAQADRAKAHKKYSARVGTAPAFPPACLALIAP